MGEIHASYEHLDPKLYRTPYWEWKEFYFFDDSSEKVLTVDEVKTHRLADQASNFISIYPIMIGVDLPNNGGKRYVPIGDFCFNAYTALFKADPTSWMAYYYYARAKAIYQIHFLGTLKYETDENKRYIRDGKSLLMLENALPRIHRMNEITGNLDGIVKKVTPYNVVASAFMYQLDIIEELEKSGNFDYCRMGLRAANEIKKDMDAHPQKVMTEVVAKLLDRYDAVKDKDNEWKAQSKPATGMPATYNMGADLEAKALAAAKKQFAGVFDIDKVVFLSNSWSTFKEPDYPYRVRHRSLLVGFLTKSGDGYVLRKYNFQQPGDGKTWENNYGFTAPFDGSHNPQKVNYK